MEEQRKPRRRLRFGIRSLLIFMSATGILCGCVAWQLSALRRHQVAATELMSAGCEVVLVDRQSMIGNLARRMGFGSLAKKISHVTIRGRSDASKAVEWLRAADEVETISVYDSALDDLQLGETLKSIRVKQLYAPSTGLPRTRIAWLNHEGLTWLCICRTQFSDVAINDLPMSLEYFDATRTRISDEGLVSFVRLKKLKTLILRRTPTTYEAVNDLRRKMPWCKITWEELKKP